MSETPIDDSLTPIVTSIEVIQPTEAAAPAVGDQVTLLDGQAGTISRIDGTMIVLTDDQGNDTLQHAENIA